jgi:hypothetical protein
MASKSKVKKSGSGFGVKAGGSGKMFGKQAAGPQKSGTAGKSNSGNGGDWAKGGSGKMFGYTGSKPASPR